MEAEVSLFELFRWDFIQFLSILDEETTSKASVELMLKVHRNNIEEHLEEALYIIASNWCNFVASCI